MNVIFYSYKLYEYMREDILRILKYILRRKVKSQGQSIDFD